MDSELYCEWTKRGWKLDGAPCADVHAAFAARPFLQELTVFDCGDAIPAEACMDLAAALPQLQGLASLELCLPGISEAAAQAFAAALPRLQGLASLVLGLRGIGEAAAQAFAAALPRLQGLASLTLDLTISSEAAAQAFAAALPRLQGLASLELDLTGIGEAAAQAFVAALPRLQGLASLGLVLPRISEAAAQAFAAALPRLQGLASLVLDITAIRDAALQAFAAALPGLQHLTKLTITGSLNRSNAGYQALGNAAAQLKLTSLSCSKNLKEFFEEASRLASIRQLLLDDDAWGVALQHLAAQTAGEEQLAGLLQCIGGSEGSVGLNSSCEELQRQLSESCVANDAPLRQALDTCALEKLKRCLPPTYDREGKARRLIDQCQEDPVRLLPAMWSRLHRELGSTPVPHQLRAQRTVLVIAPGFALQPRPEQFQHVTRGGWQVRTCQAPDPQGPGFNMGSAIVLVEKDIAAHRPDVILAASRGGAYLMNLWERGCTLPSIMINVPLQCSKLPETACTILCHGSRDGTFRRTRKDLETLMQSGSPEHHFLYYTEDSGRNGHLREGDRHEMQSLLQHDALNRLVEAAVAAADAESPCPPDQYLVETWKGFLSAERREAEKLLGHSPGDLLKLWDEQSGHDNASLLEVEAQSREFEAVRAIFLSESPAGRHYGSRDVPGRWRATQVLRVQRVQNGMHQEGLQARHDAFRCSIRSQGLDFKADVHTRWLFHGPGSMESLESIVHDMDGFNPLLSGSAVGALWGVGVYFARDAQYVAEPPYVVQHQSGEKQVLLCLVETGMPCQASPNHTGQGLLLPYRKQRHRFHSTVDSLSNPEVWIVQKSTQALPAYVITFA